MVRKSIWIISLLVVSLVAFSSGFLFEMFDSPELKTNDKIVFLPSSDPEYNLKMEKCTDPNLIKELSNECG